MRDLIVAGVLFVCVALVGGANDESGATAILAGDNVAVKPGTGIATVSATGKQGPSPQGPQGTTEATSRARLQEQVSLAQKSSMGTRVEALTIADGMAYIGWLAVVGDKPVSGFQIVDIRDPAAPNLKCSIKGSALTEGRAEIPVTISIVRKTAYVGWSERGGPPTGRLEIFDVQDPSVPKSLGTLPLPGVEPASLVVSDRVAYFGYRTGLYVADVGDATAPRLLATHQYEGGQFLDALAADHARVYLGLNGIRTVDVADPYSPKDVGIYRADSRVFWLSLQNGIAYAGVKHYKRWPANIDEVASAELIVVDLNNPQKPLLLGKTEIAPSIDSLALGNGVVYGLGGEEIHTYGLRDLPSSPTAAVPTASHRAMVEKDRLFTACKDGFRVYDVSAPLSPHLIGTYKLEHHD